MSKFLEECRAWRRSVRLALYHSYHKKGIEYVSDNEVYELLFVARKLPAPPMAPGYRDGLPRALVFVDRETDHPYYEPTKLMIPSIDPSARGRKIRVYEYCPLYDTRPVGIGVTTPSTEWLEEWSGSF